MNARLVRTDRSDKIVAGVCGGLARRLGMSASVVRLVFLASLLLPGPQLVGYLLLWAVMPREDSL